MRNTKRLLITRALPAAAFVSSGMLLATASSAMPLSSTHITELVTGATVHIDTPLGITLPMMFEADGTVRGTAGKLAFYMESESDQGRWWVENNKLCQKWRRWFEAKTSCLSLKREGSKYAWARDDGKTGTASIVVRDPVAVASKIDPIPGARALGGPAAGGAEPTPVALSSPPPPSTSANMRPIVAGRPPATRPVTPIVPARTEANVQPRPVPVTATPAVAEPPKHQVTVATVAPGGLGTRGITYRVVNVAHHDTLNIRTAPNANSQVVATVPSTGRGLVMIGNCTGQWCPMSHAGRAGWVNKVFLALEPMTAAVAR